MNAPALMNTLRERGFALAVADGKLVVRPATELTTADREAIRLHLPELIAELGNEAPTDKMPPTVSDAWDADLAHHLQYDADALVSDLGVSGLHPAVQHAAAAVVRAHMTENMTQLRNAVSVFVSVVRGLGARSSTEPAPGEGTGGVLRQNCAGKC